MPRIVTTEDRRLEEARTRKKHWKRWGPYLSERQWGTVREDYSPGGTAWEFFPHDHARSRTYRWGEDGIGGVSDRHQMMCFGLALWNGRDPILKERMFGLTGNEGNHGEDVKEYYFYLDATPTYSYMRMLYKYPQREFPYAQLVEENRRRGREQPEFELLDTGIFAENRYFDIYAEYAKADVEDILIKITAVNRGPQRPLRFISSPHSGSAIPGRGAGICAGPTPAWLRAFRKASAQSCSTGNMASVGSSVRASPNCFSPRMKRTTPGYSARETAHLTSKMRSTSTSFMGTKQP